MSKFSETFIETVALFSGLAVMAIIFGMVYGIVWLAAEISPWFFGLLFPFLFIIVFALLWVIRTDGPL